MSGRQTGSDQRLMNARAVFTALTTTLLLGACVQPGEAPLQTLSHAAGQQTEGEAPGRAKTELEKAIEYWGRQHGHNPRDLTAAISYARNLRADGRREQALSVLQHASIYNGNNLELASEYGRLALDLGQVSLAQKLLAAADDPANPDWRVISARGTVLAKQGNYTDAIPLFERALVLAPEHPSLLNNLALAYAADGRADTAEALLRRAVNAGENDARVRQNLALVLRLQGKYEESKQVVTDDLTAETASGNINIRRSMAQLPQASGRPVRRGELDVLTRGLRGSISGTAAADNDNGVTPVAQGPASRH